MGRSGRGGCPRRCSCACPRSAPRSCCDACRPAPNRRRPKAPVRNHARAASETAASHRHPGLGSDAWEPAKAPSPCRPWWRSAAALRTSAGLCQNHRVLGMAGAHAGGQDHAVLGTQEVLARCSSLHLGLTFAGEHPATAQRSRGILAPRWPPQTAPLMATQTAPGRTG